jgi:molybdopterin converting factor small subunit
MVTIHVTHMGSVAKPGRLAHLDVQVPHEMSVRELVFHLLDRGDSIGRREDYRTDPSELLHIIVNGASVRTLQGPDTILKDGDSVAMLIPLVGGCAKTREARTPVLVAGDEDG